MWRDLLGYAGAALAIINGVLAMVVARLTPRQSVFKLRLGVFALVLGLIGFGATLYAQHYTRVQTERRETGRVEVRKRLDNFMVEGRAVLAQIKDVRREMPTREADEWAQRVELFLRERIGDRGVTRFRREAGDLMGEDPAVIEARRGYWRAVRNRVVNLEMISAELADLPLRR